MNNTVNLANVDRTVEAIHGLFLPGGQIWISTCTVRSATLRTINLSECAMISSWPSSGAPLSAAQLGTGLELFRAFVHAAALGSRGREIGLGGCARPAAGGAHSLINDERSTNDRVSSP